VVGAGFFSIGCNSKGEFHLNCSGESVSLKIKSRGKQDAKVLRWVLFGMYDTVIIE
jgi:hypothetical protein